MYNSPSVFNLAKTRKTKKSFIQISGRVWLVSQVLHTKVPMLNFKSHQSCSCTETWKCNSTWHSQQKKICLTWQSQNAGINISTSLSKPLPCKAKLLEEAMFFIIIFTYLNQIIQVQNGNGASADQSHVLNARNQPTKYSRALLNLYNYFR